MSENNKKTILNDDDLEKVSGGAQIIEIIEEDVPGVPVSLTFQCPKCHMSVQGKQVGTLNVYEIDCPNCHEHFEIRP